MKLFRVGILVIGALLAVLAAGLVYLLIKDEPSLASSGDPSESPAVTTSATALPPSPPPPPRSVARAAMPHDSFEQLLATAPHLAAAEVASLPEATELKDARLARLFEVWVATAPQDAAEWTATLPTGTFRDEAMQELGAAWGKVDTDAASQWAERAILAGELIPASALLSVWGREDPNAAAEWVSRLSDAEETDIPASVLARLTGSLTYAWATSEPENAARWVADQQDPGVRSLAMINLTAGWAEKDPSALAAWLKTNIPTQSAEAVATYATLASHWADTEADAAGKWVTSLPDGDLRDTTLATFASSLAMSEPTAALQWSQAIGDKDARQEAELDIYETWLDDDLDTARDALVTTIPTLQDRAFQHELYNLLHEKDPVFRDELYNLILPEGAPPATSTEPEPTAELEQQPEVRRALPATEESVDVKAMAE